MSFTIEQKTELGKIQHQYERIAMLSNKAGTNPDTLINEFHFKFMDVTEMNRNIIDERNNNRQKAFQNNNFRNHRTGL